MTITNYGKALKKYMQNNSLTLDDVAASIQCNRQAIYDWRKGNRPMPLKHVLRFLEVYNVDLRSDSKSVTLIDRENNK